MKLSDHLSKSTKAQLKNIKVTLPKKKKKTNKPKPKKEEKVDWADIMGSNNRGMKRGKGGAMRRK